MNGDVVPLSLAAAQTGTLTFDGTVGQSLGIGITALMTSVSKILLECLTVQEGGLYTRGNNTWHIVG